VIFFFGVHSPKNIITHFDETFAQYEQLSLSLFTPKNISLLYSLLHNELFYSIIITSIIIHLKRAAAVLTLTI